MLLILASWIYILLITIPQGVALSKLCKIKPSHPVYTVLLGWIQIMVIASVWAFFGRIHWEFQLFLLFVTLYYFIRYKDTIFNELATIRDEFLSFSKSSKLLFGISCLLILLQSATLPTIIDNETYYVQSIKWLNEYGLVKGLANLHLFLGQMSGWHILQSAFNFNFITSNLNDLNGLLLICILYYSFSTIESIRKTEDLSVRIVGLFGCMIFLLFPFINSPSPDLAIYCISFLVFVQFISEKPNVKLLWILAIVATYIKLTAFILVLFPVIHSFRLIRNNTNNKNSFPWIIGLLFGLLFFCKNYVVTGHIFFPIQFSFNDTIHAVPKEIMEYFFSAEIRHSHYLSSSEFTNATFFQKLGVYFYPFSLDGLMAWLSLIVLAISLYISIINKNRQIAYLFIVFIMYAVLLSFGSPQFRFYLGFTIFFFCYALANSIVALRKLNLLLSGSLIITLILFFTPSTLNPYNSSNSLKFYSIIVPNSNSNFQGTYTKYKIGNTQLTSPEDYTIFWQTYDGTLPCVTKEQIDYISNYFQYEPQLIENELRNGFYSKKATQ